MKFADEIMQARVFMGGDCVGTHRCASCGIEERAVENYKKALKVNFTNYNELLLSGGVHLCQGCIALLNDNDLRFRPVLFREFGVKTVPERDAILPLLKEPPEMFVLSLPYSYKKHHWLFAGLSTNSRALVGTDNRTVEVNYAKYPVAKVIDEIRIMVAAGIPRNEIILGNYSTITRHKFNGIEESEDVIKPMRPCGAVEMFVKYTPAQKERLELKGGTNMISDTEAIAAQILYEIALNSYMRANDGLRFWGGYYERRINRFKQLALHEFISKLAASVGTGCHINTKLIGDLAKEREELIMNDIRDKTNLVLSLAYDIQKVGKKV